MGEDNEHGLGHAYVISDSTFEKARRIPAIVLVVDRPDSTWLREGREGKVRINELEQREKLTRTRKSQELEERKEDGIQNRDSDCFAGDMIILSVSVFKEDVALDPKGLNEEERMARGKRGSLCPREAKRDEDRARCISVRIFILVVIEPREKGGRERGSEKE